MWNILTAGGHNNSAANFVSDRSKDGAIVWLRRLLWLYFVLWMLEGALRKWVVPSLSNMLLIVRDPVVLLIYALAVARGLFPRNYFLTAFTILGVIFAFAGALVLAEAPSVVAFGLRTNFLFLPLLYLVPKVWDRKDVQRIGQAVLILSIPMALLMVSQFFAGSDSWLNRGAGGSEGAQLGAALGHIRPAGTFTFVTGPPLFYSLVAAFVMNAQFVTGKGNFAYSPLLTGLASVALVLAMVVSGSRTMLASVGIVILFGVLMAALVRPQLLLRLLKGAAVAVIAVLIVSQFGVFQEGTATLTSRIDVAADAEGGSSGILERAFSDFTKPFELWSEVPIFGHGLGMGTNVGAKLLTGDNEQFLLAEIEWARVLMESGPVLGSLYLLLRVIMAVAIGGSALWFGRLNGDALPLLLFGTCAVPLINGSWGQSTMLGFAIFASGLVLAAMKQESSSMGTFRSMKPVPPSSQRRLSLAPSFDRGLQ